jgi:type I restriction enzyme M protein
VDEYKQVKGLDRENLRDHMTDIELILTMLGEATTTKQHREVRQEYLSRLVNHYKYLLEQMGQEIQVNNSPRGQRKARADLVIWKSKEEKTKGNSPVIVVECKAKHITIRKEDYFRGITTPLGLERILL